MILLRTKKHLLYLTGLCLGIICLIGFIYIFQAKSMRYWLLPYLQWELNHRQPESKPVHIMFLIVDHFEPTTLANMKSWTTRWPKVVSNHFDADGVPPQYTWAYFIDGFDKIILKELAKLPEMGLGEIEVQLHHADDTPESFRQKLIEGKERLREVGATITTDGQERFAYIAGNWALDNSVIINGQNRSGVNSELIILKEEGCFADFTMPPAMGMAMPSLLNRIYYAVDNPQMPKSYNTGINMSANRKPSGDLLIFQGPFSINLRDWSKRFYPDINTGNIQASDPPSPLRVDEWVRVGIHVEGRRDWVFIKLHTHGAHPPIREMLFGPAMDNLFTYLETKYNDGSNYILHYVTAREAYNIAKAAEAGKQGNPNQYRNYIVQPYQNTRRPINN